MFFSIKIAFSGGDLNFSKVLMLKRCVFQHKIFLAGAYIFVKSRYITLCILG